MEVLLFPLLLLVWSSQSVRAKPPNIIFILSDDLGYGDVSISPMVNRTNEIPTPNVQRLADEGMRFLRGYSGQVCAPSRCTLMTGRHLGHCTVRGNGGSYTPLLPTDYTVGRVLRDAYTTGVVGKWGLGDFNSTGYPLAQGFDYYVGQASQMDCHNWYPGVIQNNTEGSYVVESNMKANNETCGDHHSKCTWANDMYAREAVDFIRRHGKDEKPFFLFFSTTTPHTGFLNGLSFPYPVPAPYDSRFHYQNALQEGFASATSAQDDFVGAVLDELKGQQLDEDTIVFFSGDNGPDSHPFDFFDDPGPFRGKKRSLHEGGVRQTIVARWPGHIAANSTTDHLFAFWDFLPTAAELGNVTLPPGIDGVSAAAVLQGKEQQQKKHKYLYWEFCNYAKQNGLLPQQYPGGWLQSIRYDAVDAATGFQTEWKGIRSDKDAFVLYNLTADISESHDLSQKFPDIVDTIVSYMNEAHVENPNWKSGTNKKTDKCCTSCSHYYNCGGGCNRNRTRPSHHRAAVPGLRDTPYELAPFHVLGDWGVSEERHAKGTRQLSIVYDEASGKPRVISPGSSCLHDAVIHFRARQGGKQVAVLHSATTRNDPTCFAHVIGQLKSDGNTLYIQWKTVSTASGHFSEKHTLRTWWRDFDYD